MRVRALLAGALVTLLASSPAAAQPFGDGYKITAHRGYHAHVTENTLGALRRAAARGATAMETDVRLTEDGYFLIMHDATLARTTTCRGWVHEVPKRRVKRHCRAEDGQRLPFAVDLLREAHRERLNVLMEVKPDPLDRWNRKRFQDLAHLVRRTRMDGRFTLSSMYPHLLTVAHRAVPWLPTMWIAREAPQRVRTTDVSAKARDLTADRVQRLQHDGHKVYGHSTDVRADWQQYHDLGVDGVVTDSVPAYVVFLSTVQQ